MATPNVDITLAGTTIQSILQGVSNSLPSVVAMVMGFSYLTGFWFIYRGIYKLKQYGELRTMMSSHTELKDPLLYFVAGAFLLFLPSVITIFESTFFLSYTPTPISYAPKGNSPWDALLNIVYIVIRFLGLIAFIRGIMMITQIGQQTQHDSTKKAFTHIIGGILLINITQTVSVLATTFGIGGSG